MKISDGKTRKRSQTAKFQQPAKEEFNSFKNELGTKSYKIDYNYGEYYDVFLDQFTYRIILENASGYELSIMYYSGQEGKKLSCNSIKIYSIKIIKEEI